MAPREAARRMKRVSRNRPWLRATRVKAYRDAVGDLQFWCRRCKKWHYHGSEAGVHDHGGFHFCSHNYVDLRPCDEPAPQQCNEPNKRGLHHNCIYAARVEEWGPIKIGYAKGCVEYRLSGLRCGCPWPIYIVALAHGELHKERIIQRRFAAWRMAGEWFQPAAELLDYIQRAMQVVTPELLQESKLCLKSVLSR